MTTQQIQETNLYLTVVPGHRIEFDFLRNPTMDALIKIQAITERYSGLSFYNLNNTRYVLVGSKVHNLEQIGKEIKTRFEAFDFSFTVKGQIDLYHHSVDL